MLLYYVENLTNICNFIIIETMSIPMYKRGRFFVQGKRRPQSSYSCYDLTLKMGTSVKLYTVHTHIVFIFSFHIRCDLCESWHKNI